MLTTNQCIGCIAVLLVTVFIPTQIEYVRPGSISRRLDAVTAWLRPIFEAVGNFFWRCMDIIWVIEKLLGDYFRAMSRYFVSVWNVLTSWFWIFVGILKAARDYEHSWRSLIGCIIFTLLLCVFVEIYVYPVIPWVWINSLGEPQNASVAFMTCAIVVFLMFLLSQVISILCVCVFFCGLWLS